MSHYSQTTRNGFIQIGAERMPAQIELAVEYNMHDVTVFGGNPSRIFGRTQTEIRARVSASDGMRLSGLFNGLLAVSIGGEMLVGAARLTQVTVTNDYGDASFQCDQMSTPDLRQRTKIFREANL